MLALRKNAPRFGAEVVTLEALEAPPASHVLIDVAAAGICGSDLHAYEWTPGYEFMAGGMPVTIGHEFAGTVSAVGPTAGDFLPGDRVVCWPTVGCGACDACGAGQRQDCPSRCVLGLHVDGGFAEQVYAPATNCRRVSDTLPLEIAALSEPLAVAVNAVDAGDVAAGDKVVVLGPGPIGLAIAWVAQHRGAEVLVAGMNDARRLACAREIGLRHCVDLAEASLETEVHRVLGRPGDRVFEATGVSASLADGLAILRSGGVLVVAGIHSEHFMLNLTRFVREKKQLRAAHDTTDGAFCEAMGLLAVHGHVLSRLISHRLPLARAIEAFELARSRQAVKVLLLPTCREREGEASA